MAVKKGGLGKGLDSMIPDKIGKVSKDQAEVVKPDTMMDINKVEPNREQPRKSFDEDALLELSESIKQFGVIQPLIVQDRKTYYEIIAGERRWRAAKMAGLKEVPVIIKNYTEQEIMEISLIENIQREDLNPIDLARSYKELIEDYGITHEEVAKRLSKSRAQITNTLRLLELNPDVQNLILENKISQGHAKILVTLSKDEQSLVANSVIGQKLSVHDTEKIVKNFKENKDSKVSLSAKIYTQSSLNQDSIIALNKYCDTLKSYGIKAKIQKNKCIVEFSNDEEVKKFSKILPI